MPQYIGILLSLPMSANENYFISQLADPTDVSLLIVYKKKSLELLNIQKNIILTGFESQLD